MKSQSQPCGPSFWAGRLVPAGLLAVLFLLGCFQIQNDDFWIHLTHGRWMAEQGRVPRVDPSSFTQAGKPWVYHGWLFGLLLYEGYIHLGPAALVVLKALWGAAAFGWLYRALRLRDVGEVWAALLVLLAAGLGRDLLPLRSQIMGLFFFCFFLWALERWRTGRARFVQWLLPFAMVLWANSHASFILGPALIALSAMGGYLDELRESGAGPSMPWQQRLLSVYRKDQSRWRGMALVFLICVLAPVVNPYGLKLLWIPFQLRSLKEFMATIGEWRSPTFEAPFAAYWLTLAVALVAVLLQMRSLRRGDLLLFMLLTGLSLGARRQIGFWALGAALVLGSLPAWLKQCRPLPVPSWEVRSWRPVVARGILFLALLGVGLGSVFDRDYHPGAGFREKQFPVDAARFVKEELPPLRAFHPQRWGGFLLWHFYPRVQNFIDTRFLVFEPGFYLAHYQPVQFGLEGWERVLDEWKIDLVWWDYGASIFEEPEYRARLGRLLREHPGWALIYWDDSACLYLRDRPALEALSARHRFRYTQPDSMTLPPAMSEADAQALEKELERAARLHPDSFRLAMLEGRFWKRRGDVAKAEQALRQAVRLQPAQAPPYNDLGMLLLEQGQMEQAEAQFKRAARVDPLYANAQYNLGLLAARRNRLGEARTRFSRAVRLRPQLDQAYAEWAVLELGAGNRAEARRILGQGLAACPASWFCLNGLLAFHVQARQWESALPVAERIVAAYPQRPSAHNNLAMVLLEVPGEDRDLRRALQSARTALRLASDEAEFHDTLDKVLQAQNVRQETD